MQIQSPLFWNVLNPFLASFFRGSAGSGNRRVQCADDGQKPLSPREIPINARIPICAETNESSDSHIARQRGQFLARQDRWEEFSTELMDADRARNKTCGGTPVSELLAFGARADVICAAEHALQDGHSADHPALAQGISDLEAMLGEMPDDPGLTAAVALAHIDLAWAWRSAVSNGTVRMSQVSQSTVHFERARDLLASLSGTDLDSPLIASARCAVPEWQTETGMEIGDKYQSLIDLDPSNSQPIRALGHRLISCRTKTYRQLELEARRTAARTQEIWGAGGYTWVCLDAIAADDTACGQVDADFFIDGLRDIVCARPTQDMINLLTAYCALTLWRGPGLGRASYPSRKRISECAAWLIRDHLTEIHPLIWAHASNGFSNNARVGSVSRFAAKGVADARQVLTFHLGFDPISENVV